MAILDYLFLTALLVFVIGVAKASMTTRRRFADISQNTCLHPVQQNF